MTITLFSFKGAIPKLSSHLLPDGKAQVADGCDTTRGDLRPLKMPGKAFLIPDEPNIKTLHQWFDGTMYHWLYSDKDLDFVRNPNANDQYRRIFFTGHTQMRYYANDANGSPFDQDSDYIVCGIPAPENTPTVTSTGGTDYRAYICAFVNRYGDIGSNSPVGETSTHNAGNRVKVSNIDDPAPSNRAIDRIWLYRTNSGSTGIADFQFVCEAKYFDSAESYSVGDFVVYSGSVWECTTAHSGAWDSSNFVEGELVSDDDLGESFSYADWAPPPNNIAGLTVLANGVMCGFVGNTVYLSEPFKPHAWPYSKSFQEQVVGLAPLGSTLVVMTDSIPKLLYGNDPASMQRSDIAIFAPCRAKRTIAFGENVVFYSTDEGLVQISGSSGTVVSSSIINYDDWADIGLVHGHFYQGKYFGWAVDKGIILDFRENDFVSVPLVVFAGYVSPYDGKFYQVMDEKLGDEIAEVAAMNFIDWTDQEFTDWSDSIFIDR